MVEMNNIFIYNFKINHEIRVSRFRQKPFVLWFTGYSGAGKTSLADAVDYKLHTMGKYTYVLDGDILRHGLNSDLGFLPQDRAENIRRIGEVAKLMYDAGLIVSVACISPYEKDRKIVRHMFSEQCFFEVFVDAPLEICMQRDPKKLYLRAISSEIKNMTGLSAPYERPENPELILDSQKFSIDKLAEGVIAFLDNLK